MANTTSMTTGQGAITEAHRELYRQEGYFIAESVISPEHLQIMRDAFRLRYALIPYIYTSARQCYDEAMPLCRPLYYEWPEWDEAYASRDAYLFGDQLLVAPVLSPVEPLTRVLIACARARPRGPRPPSRRRRRSA